MTANCWICLGTQTRQATNLNSLPVSVLLKKEKKNINGEEKG